MGANHSLALFNTIVTGVAGMGLLLARQAIKRDYIALHRGLELATVAALVVFAIGFGYRLDTYGPTAIHGDLLARVVLNVVVAVHVAFAVFSIPCVLLTVITGLSNDRRVHRRLAPTAHWLTALAIVTGIAVYVLLHVWPTSGVAP